MSSDWKESALKRKDFRHTKSDPEIAKHKTKTKKYNFKIVVLNHVWNFLDNKPKDLTLGKYKKRGSAEQAAKVYRQKGYLKGFEIIVKEI